MSNLPHYDEAAHLDALRAAGVTFSKTDTSTTINVSGVALAGASSAGEKYELTLPRPATFKAAFGKEGIIQKLAKIFSKELQVDDPAFDDKVYVRAADEDTERFLENEDVRNLIVEFVGEGGTVAVDGSRVLIHAVNAGLAAIVSEKDIARFVCHVMAFH